MIFEIQNYDCDPQRIHIFSKVSRGFFKVTLQMQVPFFSYHTGNLLPMFGQFADFTKFPFLVASHFPWYNNLQSSYVRYNLNPSQQSIKHRKTN